MIKAQMPRIDDTAFQAAFALRHGFGMAAPVRATACATPPEIAAAGAAAMARELRHQAAAALYAGNEEAASSLVAQADLADRLSEGWRDGRAHFCPGIPAHQACHDRGLEVLRAGCQHRIGGPRP